MTSSASGASGLAERYAAALFDLAEDKNGLDRVADDLHNLASMIAESGDLRRLLRSPVISRKNQIKGMMALLKEAGTSELVQRFVGLVAQNRRLFALNDIIAAYSKVLAGRRGATTAEVISATDLSSDQIDGILQSLKTIVGNDVSVALHVDARILGGLVVRIGSRMVDSSLRTKLHQLRFAMKGTG